MKATYLCRFIFSVSAIAVAMSASRAHAATELASDGNTGRHRVTLQKPTNDWIEGLPLANGISAVMVWGTPARTVLSLNHVDFWRDWLSKGIDDYSAVVRESRRLRLEGKGREADEVYYKGLKMVTMPRQLKTQYAWHGFAGYTNSFQPIGDVFVELEGQAVVTDYRRTLDLRQGIATITYKNDGVQVAQEYFVPAGDDVLVVRIKAEKPLSGRIGFSRVAQPEYAWKAIAQDGRLSVVGRFDEGVASAVFVAAEVDGAADALSADAASSSLRFRDVTDLRLTVAIDSGKHPHDPTDACAKRLQTISGKAFQAIRDGHCKEHGAMFDRADLILGKTARTTVSDSDSLVAQAVAGTMESELVEEMFQMGRYLMMSCNRAGRRPANLQGIWNNQIEPMWDADWHMDMNVEMNHWLANPTNLDECNLALFRQMEQYVEPGKRIARNLAGCDGILFYTIAGGDGMMWGPEGGFWTGAAAWIAQHFWTHYEFTQDREFLAERAYPLIKQVGLFYRDFLLKNKDGKWASCSDQGDSPILADTKIGTVSDKYVTAAGFSPENAPPNGQLNNVHCTMDTALVREVMRHLLAAGKILNVDQDLWPVWQDLHDNVLPYPIAQDGVLKEWPMPLDEQPKHRHFSHIYPLFPGDEFTRESTPELFAAARGAVYLREAQGRSANFGWSYPYLSCFYARLGEGDNALENLHCLARGTMVDNLLTCGTDWRHQGLSGEWEFNVPRLFQIEAGLGASAAIAEMLLQSHQGCIRLLPALPTKWSEGRFHGLKARGAFVVDAEWSDGKIQQVSIESLQGSPCSILCSSPWSSLSISDGQPVAFAVDAPYKMIRFDTRPATRYLLRFE